MVSTLDFNAAIRLFAFSNDACTITFLNLLKSSFCFKFPVWYVRDTIHLPLIVRSDGLENMIWGIDALFAVHMDMNSHTGYCLTLGIRSPISGSSTQKINTRSLTELELVEVDDAIGFVKWVSLYSKEQAKKYPVGHPLKDFGKKKVVLQDNTSTIKMVKGGKRVCG